MYANKVNGRAMANEVLSTQLDFFTFTSPVNILTSDTVGANAALTGNAVTQAALNKLVEVIAIGGQPVILGSPYTTDGVAYTVKFVTEHSGQWSSSTLTAAVVAHQTNATAWAANTITVVIGQTL